MDKLQLIRNKKSQFKEGNMYIILVFIFVMLLIILTTYAIYIHIKINKEIYPIKKDIFYIVQNAYLALDKEELAYYRYKVDKDEFRNKIIKLLELNYNEKEIKVKKLEYDEIDNEVEIYISFEVDILNGHKKEVSIKERVKLSLMEVE